MNRIGIMRIGSSVLFALAASGCGSAGPAAGPAPEVPPDYAALPDTLVCVVDRASPAGLTELAAKARGEEIVVFEDGEVLPLSAVHPVNVIAGYAGREGWLVEGAPVTHSGARYVQTGGERRIDLALLTRVGEHMGILLFAGTDDSPPPDAIYVPTAPGCIFQAYVREDLMRR